MAAEMERLKMEERRDTKMRQQIRESRFCEMSIYSLCSLIHSCHEEGLILLQVFIDVAVVKCVVNVACAKNRTLLSTENGIVHVNYNTFS